MKRWVVAAGDFTPLGGMDRANYALARYLAAEGRDVHLVAHRVWPDLAASPGISVHYAARPFGAHVIGAPLLSRMASAVASRIGPAARLLANGGNTRWQGPTWIHYLHAAYEPHVTANLRGRVAAAAGRRQYLAHEAAAVRNAPTIVCNSVRTADDVRRHYGVAADRLKVIYYGVDSRQFNAVDDNARTDARRMLGLDPAQPVAVFIGALGDRRKGFDVLFDAWQRLHAQARWDARLLVVGTGAEAAAWERRAAARGLASWMTFLRFRTDIPQILAAADVLVHPARYEAYGLSAHEAVCRGLPVIVSDAAGVAERLTADLRPLILRDPITADDLMVRLQVWRQNMDAWRARAEAAGDALRLRSWDHMAADIAAVVEQV